MIVPDTSIWIEFFKQNDPVKDKMIALLENRRILAIEPVFAELLYGVRTKKDRVTIQSYWNTIPKIDIDKNVLLKAAEFANAHGFYNLGIGLMDATILKPVMELNYSIWTLDKRILRAIDDRFIYLPNKILL